MYQEVPLKRIFISVVSCKLCLCWNRFFVALVFYAQKAIDGKKILYSDCGINKGLSDSKENYEHFIRRDAAVVD